MTPPGSFGYETTIVSGIFPGVWIIENHFDSKRLEECLRRRFDEGGLLLPRESAEGNLFALAAGIRRSLPAGSGPTGFLCLATGSRRLTAAAVVASLTGGPRLVLPHTLSSTVIREIHDSYPLLAVLADDLLEVPRGVPVVVQPPESEAEIPALTRGANEPFLELFTGGSTGSPRLWSKTPANLFGEAFYLAERFGVGSSDRVLATVPPVHIYGLLFSVLLPLVTGARVSGAMPSFPAEIAAAIRKFRATVLVSVPVHYRVLNTVSLGDHSLRRAFSSAGMLDASDALQFHEETGIGITEVYGSTETGGIAFRNRADDGPCWHPFEVVDWKIQGELLHVRSPFLSPEMERDADGFAATGDRVEAAGVRSFDLLGRMDGIVKVGGKRVDLREVLEKLKRLEGVSDAYVTALPVGTGRQQEVAALVVSGRGDHELKAALESVLETPARPRLLRVVRRIPVLATGKPDRARIEEILRHGDPDDCP